MAATFEVRKVVLHYPGLPLIPLAQPKRACPSSRCVTICTCGICSLLKAASGATATDTCSLQCSAESGQTDPASQPWGHCRDALKYPTAHFPPLRQCSGRTRRSSRGCTTLPSQNTFLENVVEASFFHITSHCLFLPPCPDK